MPQRHRNHSERGERAKEEDEALLRSFEAEEERLVNSLTRKLERVRLPYTIKRGFVNAPDPTAPV